MGVSSFLCRQTCLLLHHLGFAKKNKAAMGIWLSLVQGKSFGRNLEWHLMSISILRWLSHKKLQVSHCNEHMQWNFGFIIGYPLRSFWATFKNKTCTVVFLGSKLDDECGESLCPKCWISFFCWWAFSWSDPCSTHTSESYKNTRCLSFWKIMEQISSDFVWDKGLWNPSI